MTDLLSLWQAGFVARWHQNPVMAHHYDPICGHQGRVAVLAWALWPDLSRELLLACVLHDLHERTVGDLSAPAKARTDGAVGALARAYRVAEVAAAHDMGTIFALDDRDRRRLTFVDRLDARLFAELREPLRMGGDDWDRADKWILAEAASLGVTDIVETALYGSGQ